MMRGSGSVAVTFQDKQYCSKAGAAGLSHWFTYSIQSIGADFT